MSTLGFMTARSLPDPPGEVNTATTGAQQDYRRNDAELWQELAEESGLRFALDRGPADALRGVSVRVWKPACVPHPPAGESFCITHNMDHELGRRYAAYRAATFDGPLVTCGLGQGDFGGGTGLGMDEKLAALPWREL